MARSPPRCRGRRPSCGPRGRTRGAEADRRHARLPTSFQPWADPGPPHRAPCSAFHPRPCHRGDESAEARRHRSRRLEAAWGRHRDESTNGPGHLIQADPVPLMPEPSRESSAIYPAASAAEAWGASGADRCPSRHPPPGSPTPRARDEATSVSSSPAIEATRAHSHPVPFATTAPAQPRRSGAAARWADKPGGWSPAVSPPGAGDRPRRPRRRLLPWRPRATNDRRRPKLPRQRTMARGLPRSEHSRPSPPNPRPGPRAATDTGAAPRGSAWLCRTSGAAPGSPRGRRPPKRSGRHRRKAPWRPANASATNSLSSSLAFSG
mmetsp:Transcript_30624/g.101874  ORF Transcript_30624/g.101874 Transcript_30624/m.101874 type:complete len:322 (+) Transcript_30624:3170-4135(+)